MWCAESRKRRPQLQDTPWPADERQRRGVGGMQVTVTSTATTGPAVDAARLKLHRTFKGHMAAIAAVAFHPKMPLGTVRTHQLDGPVCR